MAEQAIEQPVRLATRLADLPGIGPGRARRFKRLDIETVSDLLRHLPMRYVMEYAEGTIADLPMDGIGTARGTIINTRWNPSGLGGKGRFQATLQDHGDRIYLVWFNAGYLRKQLNPGMTLRVQGRVKAFGGYPQMVNPKWEVLPPAPQPLPPGAGAASAPGSAAPGPTATPAVAPRKEDRLCPIYPATEGLNSAAIEKIIASLLPQVLPQIVDPLMPAFLRERNMPPLAEAYRMAHQPAHDDEAAAARRRLAFNELLLLQLGIAVKRHFNETALAAPALRFSKAIDEHIRARFPFTLTPGQEQVITEIAADLQRTRPMNRLVQGDVGAGKTIVALYALLIAVANRRQGALMAPTELLAEQHFRSISAMLTGSNVRVELLVGKQTVAQRRNLLDAVAAGQVDIVVGTHALLTDKVRFAELAVVVVDEQHRFGVMQRAALRSRETVKEGEGVRNQESGVRGQESGEALDPVKGLQPRPPEQNSGLPTPDLIVSPHCLVMTATPIPRTLSLTVFGDLDISTITGLPPGRVPIITRVVGPEKSDDVYRFLAQRLAQGEQAYVVVPIIDEAGQESAVQLKNVRAHARLLQDKYCRGFKVAAIHGRMQRDTREQVMQKFRDGQVHVLVATTVIEVGVDVPNATMMVVEHAERFGLSQLHQLRGRVGRGGDGKRSLCAFIAEPATEDASKRLQAIAATSDGFQIAEMDLEIRGTGDIFGTRQHGAMPLRVARIPQDLPLLQMAKRDADQIVTQDPTLSDPDRLLLRKVLVRDYGDTLGLVDVG